MGLEFYLFAIYVYLFILIVTAARVWTPYKELQMVVEAAIHKKQPDAIHDLEVMLRKHKADFLSLLKTLVSIEYYTHQELKMLNAAVHVFHCFYNPLFANGPLWPLVVLC